MKKTLFISLILCAGLFSNAQTVTDSDGNVYKTVTIGKQVWMAENLKSTKFNDGVEIPLINKDSEWTDLTTPGFSWYEDDRSKYGDLYGALYNWYAVKTGKLCPAGWHVPSDAEWTVLTDFLGGIECTGRLKEKGQDNWEFPNNGATNETGFTALPSGRRNSGGNFSGIGERCYFWSSTAEGEERAWYRGIGNATVVIDKYSYNSKSGFSVRCLKD